MDNIVRTVGLDLAKSSFHVFCANQEGRRVESGALRRSEVLGYFAKLDPCTVAMETCSSANWWCRQLGASDHDAGAICEAAKRPNMRFAPVKSERSSGLLSLQRTRQAMIKQRTMNVNHVRAVFAEFVVVAPSGSKGFEQLAEQLRMGIEALPSVLRESQKPALTVIERLQESIDDLHARILTSEASLRLEEIPGVGVLSATYLAAVLEDGSAYRSGRQFSASLGLVPEQRSTGGRQKLVGITKKGDPLLRKLVFEGAFAVLGHRIRDGGRNFPGTARRVKEKSLKGVAVELANRNARTAWSMIRHGTRYDPQRQRMREQSMAA
ncbi:MAG: IS110 family transposase [Gammaproteobacteria bacterium]|nr:IS110 family transposase [Gammaproteobacteria bacterium]